MGAFFRFQSACTPLVYGAPLQHLLPNTGPIEAGFISAPIALVGDTARVF